MDENVSKCLGDLGNTINQVKPRISVSIRWCFTLNNYTEQECLDCMECFNNKCRFWIIGREIGENNTPHLQGYIEFIKANRPMESFKNKRIHWEKAKGDKESNIKYCTKDGKWTCSDGSKPLKCLREDQLYDWQNDIINIIKNEPDDRIVYWYWEDAGNTGKTTFCKYLSIKFNAIPLEGKKNDVLFCAANFPSNIYVWDLERSMEEFVSYGAIEKIKNGYYMCGKYEGKPIIRNPPHIFIFANFAPDLNKLSKDRWNIINLHKKGPSVPPNPCDSRHLD